jgi:hypothetical protein
MKAKLPYLIEITLQSKTMPRIQELVKTRRQLQNYHRFASMFKDFFSPFMENDIEQPLTQCH